MYECVCMYIYGERERKDRQFLTKDFIICQVEKHSLTSAVKYQGQTFQQSHLECMFFNKWKIILHTHLCFCNTVVLAGFFDYHAHQLLLML